MPVQVIKIDTSHLGPRRADRVLAHQAALHLPHFERQRGGQFHWPYAACTHGARAIINRASQETTVTDASVEAAFEATFETRCFDYWTLVLPAMDRPWYHPTQVTTRGRFMSEADAHGWAARHIAGGPYSLRFEDWSGSED